MGSSQITDHTIDPESYQIESQFRFAQHCHSYRLIQSLCSNA